MKRARQRGSSPVASRGRQRFRTIAALGIVFCMSVSTFVLSPGRNNTQNLVQYLQQSKFDTVAVSETTVASNHTTTPTVMINLAQPPLNSSVTESSTECWVNWDQQRKIQMEQWFEIDVPVMITAVHGTRQEQKQKVPIAYAMFTQFHLKKEVWPNEWMCLYRDLNDDNSTTSMYQRKATIAPRHFRKARGNIAVSCDLHSQSSSLYGVQPVYNKVPWNVTQSNISSPAAFQYYNIELPLLCSQQEQQELAKTTDWYHTDDPVSSTSPKIGACILFKGDFDRRHIPEWIEYHRLLGIDHFWISMNEPYNMTHLYNAPYVTYKSFDMSWNDFPNHAAKYFHGRTKEVPAMQVGLTQEPVQTTCLYTAKQHRLDWVITTDVDEYIHVDDEHNATAQPLKAFLQKYSTNEHGCMAMNSIPFGTNTFIERDATAQNKYIIDQVWRKNQSLADYQFGRYKQFYNVDGVWSLGVHYCWSVRSGLKTINLHPEKDGIFLQHYKQAHRGVSARGERGMIQSPDLLMKDRWLHDKYREQLDLAMKRIQQS